MTYVVKMSSSNSPAGKRWKGYYDIALIEMLPGHDHVPSMISTRAVGVRRIVDFCRSVHIGDTDRSHGRYMLDSFERRAKDMNARLAIWRGQGVAFQD